ncbi:MAG: hypothetical protein AB7D57_14240, partial [Desulfovibrionaceae bacterium]
MTRPALRLPALLALLAVLLLAAVPARAQDRAASGPDADLPADLPAGVAADVADALTPARPADDTAPAADSAEAEPPLSVNTSQTISLTVENDFFGG